VELGGGLNCSKFWFFFWNLRCTAVEYQSAADYESIVDDLTPPVV
jgi:hypothetical protein